MAANTISLSSVSGTPQTEVEVVVSLDNSDAISALELAIPLGEHLQYVNASAVLASARSNGHQISAAQVAQYLRIYVYSFSSSTLRGNSGELLRFRLKLGNEPADYELMPFIVLSSERGTSLECIAEAGVATILAPKLQIITEQIDYGHIPIRSTYTQTLGLWNSGNLPLVISNIAVDDALITPQQTVLTIDPYSTAYVALDYAPVNRGAISRTLNVTSNAINGEQLATILADPFSVNELHVGSASGIADSIVTISLTMNNMEPIVAMQCAFVLPEELEYVANSLVVNAGRSIGHKVLSYTQGNTLVLALFSMTNQPLQGNDGEIATFQLRLNGNSGTYTLYPTEVVLSNITEENMVSATTEGYVNIQSPSLYGEDYLHFGNCPIIEQTIASYPFNNYGDASLVIERVTFLAEGYDVITSLPLQVNPWEESQLQIAYTPSAEGDFSTTMNIYTNDPTNRLKTVALSGTVYEPNCLTLSGKNTQDEKYVLSVGLDNYSNIVAVQYDLHWIDGMQTSTSDFIPTDRMSGHNYVVTPWSEGVYRVIIYSMTNTPFIGNKGLIHQLVFTSPTDMDYCGTPITINNIVLSTTAGTDKTSVASVSLQAQQAKWGVDTATACNSYKWNNNLYTQSGVYVDTLHSANGCDSVVTLHLIINYTQYTEEVVTACDSYTWNGETYTQSGEYVYNTTAANGCDSIVTLHLTVNQTQYAEETVVACDSYTWNGETYTQSGEYIYTTTAANGCDSIVTLHLTINQTQYAEETVVACDSYTWNGETYAKSGDYTYTTTAANGCDSVVTLHLTINETQYAEESVTACDSYTWNGETYTQSGEYTYATTATNGCDSVVTLHLTILPDAVTETEELVLCSSELPYEWYGELITEAGFYTVAEQYAVGCDSVVHELRLNVYIQSLPEQVTLPIVRIGEAIDVTVPSAEIYVHIASDSWYAPNALVEWYILEDAEWIVLTTDPVPSGVKQVTLKYAVDTDCGSVESDEMVISLETTNVENSQSGNTDTYKVFRNNKLWIIRNGNIYNALGNRL